MAAHISARPRGRFDSSIPRAWLRRSRTSFAYRSRPGVTRCPARLPGCNRGSGEGWTLQRCRRSGIGFGFGAIANWAVYHWSAAPMAKCRCTAIGSHERSDRTLKPSRAPGSTRRKHPAIWEPVTVSTRLPRGTTNIRAAGDHHNWSPGQWARAFRRSLHSASNATISSPRNQVRAFAASAWLYAHCAT
jgi:hypothetical protein